MIPLMIGTVATQAHYFDDWFHASHLAATATGLACHFVVVVEPQSGVHEYIDRYYQDYVLILPLRGTDSEVKNRILECVRNIRPDLFLLSHTQIAVNEFLLNNLLGTLDHFDVIGARLSGVYSYAIKRSDNTWHSSASAGVFYVDALMLLQLMTPRAYEINFEPHVMGDDFGYSEAARRAGLTLGWDGRIVNRIIH